MRVSFDKESTYLNTTEGIIGQVTERPWCLIIASKNPENGEYIGYEFGDLDQLKMIRAQVEKVIKVQEDLMAETGSTTILEALDKTIAERAAVRELLHDQGKTEAL